MKIVYPLLLIILLSSCNKGFDVTLSSLLEEQLSRKSLTYYPEVEFSLKQASSYDRNTIKRDSSGWFANQDYTNFYGEELNNGRREFVMLETNQPGAVVRWWMTFAGEGSNKGILRIYIDGNEQPVIEDSILHVLSGKSLVGEPLASSVSKQSDYLKRGHNFYLPIPYAKSCKITYECPAVKLTNTRNTPSIYYNINYREYSKETVIKSFSNAELELNRDQLNAIQIALRNELTIRPEKIETLTVPEGKTSSFSIEGSKVISSLYLKIENTDNPNILRQLLLKMSFDGIQTVVVPAGDFFGTGYLIRPFKTYYNMVNEGGELVSNWPMPFSESATIELINLSKQPIDIKFGYKLEDYKWKDNSLHFGATWNNYNSIVTAGILNPDGRKPIDLTFTKLKGKGLYAGDGIVLYNSDDAWWGEGDEKIYIDGEKFPSHIGTGTEDYYGYAWARPEVFNNHPYISQPDGSGNFYPGYTVNLRQRALDIIPFESEIESTIELLHWVSTPMDYALTAYFYFTKGSEISFGNVENEVKRSVSLSRQDLIPSKFNELGLLEGEHMELLKVIGSTTTQYIPSFNWSNKGQLWWTDAGVGDSLELAFDFSENKNEDIILQMTKANDYAIVDIYLNDQLTKSFDGYVADSVFSVPMSIKKSKLLQGRNRLLFIIKGKNKNAKDGFMVGVDFIKINN